MQNSNVLYHYGRLGMRWGQHRYRDKYGTLTKHGHAKRSQLEKEHDKLTNTTQLTKTGLPSGS